MKMKFGIGSVTVATSANNCLGNVAERLVKIFAAI